MGELYRVRPATPKRSRSRLTYRTAGPLTARPALTRGATRAPPRAAPRTGPGEGVILIAGPMIPRWRWGVRQKARGIGAKVLWQLPRRLGPRQHRRPSRHFRIRREVC